MTIKNRVKADFLLLAQDYSPKYDPWGYAMGAAFDMAAEAYNRGLPNVLEYRPSPVSGAIIEDEYNAEVLNDMSDSRLLQLCKYTARVLSMLKHFKKDY